MGLADNSFNEIPVTSIVSFKFTFELLQDAPSLHILHFYRLLVFYGSLRWYLPIYLPCTKAYVPAVLNRTTTSCNICRQESIKKTFISHIMIKYILSHLMSVWRWSSLNYLENTINNAAFLYACSILASRNIIHYRYVLLYNFITFDSQLHKRIVRYSRAEKRGRKPTLPFSVQVLISWRNMTWSPFCAYSFMLCPMHSIRTLWLLLRSFWNMSTCLGNDCSVECSNRKNSVFIQPHQGWATDFMI